jgi:hypothetical protein
LLGARSLEFSLPGEAYRAAYIVLEEEQVCLVFQVGPHENFYKTAERRYAALRRSEPERAESEEGTEEPGEEAAESHHAP